MIIGSWFQDSTLVDNVNNPQPACSDDDRLEYLANCTAEHTFGQVRCGTEKDSKSKWSILEDEMILINDFDSLVVRRDIIEMNDNSFITETDLNGKKHKNYFSRK